MRDLFEKLHGASRELIDALAAIKPTPGSPEAKLLAGLEAACIEYEHAEWLATRPACVQKLAAEFPAGSVLKHNGETLYLLGYCEDDLLIFSSINPAADYDGAKKAPRYICASCLRGMCAAHKQN